MIGPEINHHRSIRLKEYDYSSAGAYFVTVCTKDQRCFFGEIKSGEMVLNSAGQMIHSQWLEMAKRFENIALDKCVVMPNHFQGAIIIIDNECNKPRRGTTCGYPKWD